MTVLFMVCACCAGFSGMLMLVFTLVHLAGSRPTRYPPRDDLSLAVIVPCKGSDDPGFVENLRSIVTQSYRGQVEFVFSVQSGDDPAVETIQPLMEEFNCVSLCVAGLATSNAQKSHNILQAMSAVGDVDVIVVADADIRPHAEWLRQLTAPLQDPGIHVTTGFYQIVPLRNEFEIGNYLSGIYGAALWQGVSSNQIKGIWGGSMAIRRATLDEHDMRQRLETEIVDDIVIMHAVHAHKLGRAYVPTCVLPSFCQRTGREAFEWFVRQIQYSQIYFKTNFLLGHAIVFPYAFALLAVPALLLYAMIAPSAAALATAGWIVGWSLLNALLMWPGLPSRAGARNSSFRLLPWLWMVPVALVFAAAAMLETHRRVRSGVLHMRWRGIDYRVNAKTGRVLELTHPESSAAAKSKAHQAAAAGADGH